MATKEGDVEVIREGLAFKRYFTTGERHPFDDVDWEIRDAVIPNYKEGGNAFEQRDVEFPVELVAERHEHRGAEVLPRHPRHPQRESSVRQLDRPGRRHHPRLGREERLLRVATRTRRSSPTSSRTSS